MSDIKLRPLERADLHFVHELNNNDVVMRYWFEEPYEAFAELSRLYDKHVSDQGERRFIIEHETDPVGLVELVEIDYIHRRAEFQIIIAPEWQGRGYSRTATWMAVDYAFRVLNLYKVYLIVDKENHRAIRTYEGCGFEVECELKHEFFVNGEYRNAVRMCLFQAAHLRQPQVMLRDLAGGRSRRHRPPPGEAH